MRDTDVIIYGAGPAGIIAALTLVAENKKVVVIEKQKFPRFVIGESLLPYCMEALEKLNLIEELKQVGFQKKYGAVFHGEDGEECRFSFSEQYTEGFSWTWQVKRADFDLKLSQIAQERGVEILFEHTVTAVNVEDKITSITSLDGSVLDIRSKFIIDGSGYGRVLPRLLGLETESSLGERGAIFGHLKEIRNGSKDENYIIATSFNNNRNWSWKIPLSDNICSVGIVGDLTLLNKMKDNNFLDFIKHFESLDRFKDSSWSMSPKSISSYSVGVKKVYGDGFVLCGNATEFLDPIFSSGVTLAITSGYLAGNLVANQLNGMEVDWKEEYEDKILFGTNVFKSYVEAWYKGDLQKIFYSKTVNNKLRMEICSVLAGYVWDKTNPFVTKHKSIISTLAKVIDIENKRNNTV